MTNNFSPYLTGEAAWKANTKAATECCKRSMLESPVVRVAYAMCLSLTPEVKLDPVVKQFLNSVSTMTPFFKRKSGCELEKMATMAVSLVDADFFYSVYQYNGKCVSTITCPCGTSAPFDTFDTIVMVTNTESDVSFAICHDCYIGYPMPAVDEEEEGYLAPPNSPINVI